MRRTIRYTCFSMYILFVFTSYVKCATKADHDALYANLTKNHNKNSRPTLNQDQPTPVNVTMFMISIKEFDEKNSRFSFVGSFVFVWKAEDMTWNAADYGGIYATMLPQGEVWLPTLYPGNSYGEMKMIGDNMDKSKVRLYSFGLAFWKPGNVYEFKCAVDITYYPFDTQTCYLMLMPWDYSMSEIYYSVMSPNIDISNVIKHGIWDVVKLTMNITVYEPDQVVVVFFHLKRRPYYYIVNIILPILVISLLTIFVFILPAESGERVGFSITVLLAMAVFLTIVSDNLPQTSEPNVSLLSFFLFAEIAISTLSTIFTIAGLRLYHHNNEGKKMHKCLEVMARSYATLRCQGFLHSANVKKISKVEHIKIGVDENASSSAAIFSERDSNRKQVPTNHAKGLDDNLNALNEYDSSNVQTVAWSDVACAFDFYCFILFFVIFVAKNVAFVVVYTVMLP